MKEFDLIIIGTGPGGYNSAIYAAKQGMKVGIIESGQLGGTCLNRGCIPTKILINYTDVLHEIKKYEGLGLTATEVHYDYSAFNARINALCKQLQEGLEFLFKTNKITFFYGIGMITGANEVTVRNGETTEKIQSEKILIATGSKPVKLNIPGIDLENVISSDELLKKRDGVYKRLVIIGGGVIGVEFASIFSALGSKVTIIEQMDNILTGFDKDIVQNLKMLMKRENIDVLTGCKVERFEQTGELACYFSRNQKEQCINADAILVAVGRTPNTDNLFGNEFKISIEGRKIQVDKYYRTSCQSIYAIGDVIGQVQLAHAAAAQGKNSILHMLGRSAAADISTIPSCVYTNPEIAAVGFSEEKAKAHNINYIVGKYVMNANSKSLITMQERGLIKIICESDSHIIIGAHLMCARATDLINELSTAIVNRLTVEQLAAVIRPHPTFGEGISEALEEILHYIKS